MLLYGGFLRIVANGWWYGVVADLKARTFE